MANENAPSGNAPIGNAPKPSSASRDGVTTDPQSGSRTTGAATPITSPSQPAGSPPGTGDAGSEKNLKKVNAETDEVKRNREATENQEVDKETGIVARKFDEDNEDKPTTIIRAVDSEAADKHVERLKTLPVFENQTQSLLGVPGNVNLTQDGVLAGDKSLRDDRSVEDVNKEIEDKAGPNPLPNREGNELTKASNFMATAFGTGTLGHIDRNTNVMARELKEMSKKDSLSQEDKDRLEEMSKKLQDTGRVPVA